LPDREFAPRQCALLIAINRQRSREHGIIQRHSGEAIGARAARAQDFDLRRGDETGHREAFSAGLGTGNGARQGSDLLGHSGIKPRRPAQAMPERIARGPRLALGRLWTAAGAAAPATRFTPALADRTAWLQCAAGREFNPFTHLPCSSLVPESTLLYHCSWFVLNESKCSGKDNLGPRQDCLIRLHTRDIG
jgi:hypothetical protein